MTLAWIVLLTTLAHSSSYAACGLDLAECLKKIDLKKESFARKKMDLDKQSDLCLRALTNCCGKSMADKKLAHTKVEKNQLALKCKSSNRNFELKDVHQSQFSSIINMDKDCKNMVFENDANKIDAVTHDGTKIRIKIDFSASKIDCPGGDIKLQSTGSVELKK